MSASRSARKSFRSINGRKQLKQPNGLLPWRAGAGELTFGLVHMRHRNINLESDVARGFGFDRGGTASKRSASVISYLGSSHGNRAAFQSIAMRMRERPLG